MTLTRLLAAAAVLIICLAGCSRESDSPGSGDGVAPTDAAAAPAEVTPEALAVLDKMAQAYRRLKSAEFSGTLRHGLAQDRPPVTDQFTSRFQEPNRFRYEIEHQLLAVSTGKNVYLCVERETADGERRKLYVESDETAVGQLPADMPDQLQSRNLSLYLALAEDPVEAVQRGAQRVERLPDETLDGRTLIALQFDEKDRSVMRLLVDPQTYLLRRVTVDVSKMPVPERASGTPVLEWTTDYTTVDPGPTFADDTFAWTPPPDALNVTPPEVGKPAPDFTLSGLDGRTVSLADLKGKVVVLDFWATWCGPCIQALPHFAQLSREMQGRDVRFYAVNLQEATDAVGEFVHRAELPVPVLLDQTGDVAARYRVVSIPYTVVIGRDGRITRMFTGLPPQEYGQLRTAVVEALGRPQGFR